jgi:hypothetical protein
VASATLNESKSSAPTASNHGSRNCRVHLWLDRFRSDLHSVYPYVISCQQFHLRIRASYLIWKTQRHRQCHIAFQSTMAANPNGLLRRSTPGWSSIKQLPCLVIDVSQGGFRLRGSFKLTHGQLVEIILDDMPLQPVQCEVIWVGNEGSKQAVEAGLRTLGR